MAPSASELYTSRLRSSEDGIPLFTPEPNENLCEEYQQTGTSIGDVGFLRNGSFEPLFNTVMPSGSSINCQRGVPTDFRTFPLKKHDITKRRYHHSQGSILTNAVACTISVGAEASSSSSLRFPPIKADSGITLDFRSKAGAALVLPQGASRQNLLPMSRFRRYVYAQAKAWYAFAEKEGYIDDAHFSSSGNELFVVTGCDKTSSWAITTASSLSTRMNFSLKLELIGLVESRLEPKFEWERSMSSTIRMSSNNAIGNGENQCIFVRGFIVPKEWAWPRWTFTLKKVLLMSASSGEDRNVVEGEERRHEGSSSLRHD